MVDYNDLVRGTMSERHGSFHSILNPEEEEFHVFDEFVIDVSLSVMIKQRDMLTMLNVNVDLIGWINDILWNWANENEGKNWWLVGRRAGIEGLPNFEDLK